MPGLAWTMIVLFEFPHIDGNGRHTLDYIQSLVEMGFL
jgi:hypothetical protein